MYFLFVRLLGFCSWVCVIFIFGFFVFYLGIGVWKFFNKYYLKDLINKY